jgi:hypothetical protein
MLRRTLLCLLLLCAAGCQNDAVEFGDDDQAPAAATPVVEQFAANPTVVPAGGTVELTYAVRDATSVTIAVEGGQTLLPASTLLSWTFSTPPIGAATTFVLTATNGTETVESRVSVAAEGGGPVGPALHASIEDFATSSIDILAGESATLTWSTTNASAARLLANDEEMLNVATVDLASGSQIVSPGATTVYTLVVQGSDGQEVTAVTAVNVAVDGAVLSARELFDRNVSPILDQRCASCHLGANPVDGPDFLGAAPGGAYDVLTGDLRMVPARPEDSILLLKGEHTGPAFTMVEAQTVTAWLLKEADERGLAPEVDPEEPPVGDFTPKTVAEALTRFGNCMQRTDWDETYGQNENTQVAYQNTTEGRCYSCHSTGTAGSFLSQSSGDTFDMNKQRPYLLKLVLPTANEDGSFRALVPAYRFRDKGGDQGHPSYQLTAERSDALNAFVDRALARFSDFTQPCP